MAEIQLKKNWGGYPPWTKKKVSMERALYLIDEGIAKFTPDQVEANKTDKAMIKKAAETAKKANETRLANYKTEYKEIVAKKEKKTSKDIERGTKLEELIFGLKEKLEEV